MAPPKRKPASANDPRRAAATAGLAALRRAGAMSDLLFLYECETSEVSSLSRLARRLGLSTQAASHTYRGLARRGLVTLSGGRYRSTVAGVDHLHATFRAVRDDLAERLDRLHVVRTTHALADGALRAGETVSLSLRDGRLVAAPGPARASRGTTQGPARKGELVEVGDLAGIVPLPFGRLRVLSIPRARLRDPALVPALRGALDPRRTGLLLAFGLEASHLVDRARPRARPVRFGVAAAASEAAKLGVDSTIVVLDAEIPRLFRQLPVPDDPTFEFVELPLERGPPRQGRSAGRTPRRGASAP